MCTTGKYSPPQRLADGDGSVVVRFGYSRDANGNPTTIERESGVGDFYYEYDRMDRLSYEAQAAAYETYYHYDEAGNRTLKKHLEGGSEALTYYSYDAAGQLTRLHEPDGWTYFSYDGSGNTVQEQRPSFTRYYDYDGRNKLTRVRSTESGWTDTEIAYDGDGNRIWKKDSGGQTYYDWDQGGLRCLRQQDGAGATTARHVHGHSPTRGVGDIAQVQKGGSVYVPTPDQVGTIWSLLDSSGAKANTYSYDAFGVGRSASETVENDFRFQTKPLDSDIGQYYFVARQYDQSTGRFTTRDPAEQGNPYRVPGSGGRSRRRDPKGAAGYNLYVFVSGRVVMMNDPMGLTYGMTAYTLGKAHHRQNRHGDGDSAGHPEASGRTPLDYTTPNPAQEGERDLPPYRGGPDRGLPGPEPGQPGVPPVFPGPQDPTPGPDPVPPSKSPPPYYGDCGTKKSKCILQVEKAGLLHS